MNYLSKIITEMLNSKEPQLKQLHGGLHITYHPHHLRLQIARMNQFPSSTEIRTFINAAAISGVSLNQPEQFIQPGLANGHTWHICRWNLERIQLN